MSGYTVQEAALIEAPAERIYAILADYRGGHPRILPSEYFADLEVEQGGVGEGTVIRFSMNAMGSVRTLRARVSEPRPGLELTETDLDSGTVTTFRLMPDGDRTQVSISTRLTVCAGATGWLERFLTTALLQRVYARELQLLAEVACEAVEGRTGAAA